MKRGLTAVLFLILGLVFSACPVWAAASYETPPVLSAREFFPGLPLSGPHYEVQDKVPTDGFLTRAVVASDYGRFEAEGPGMLAIRLNEVDALAKLETLEGSEEFKKGAKESAGEKRDSLNRMVDKPQETLEGMAEGVGRFFERTARAAKTGFQKAGEVLDDKVPGVPDEPGKVSRLPGGGQTAQEGPRPNKYAVMAKAGGDTAVNILGFDDSRRKLAKRLRVDPYTTNKVLDEKLDEITWSMFAGDFGVDVATSLIPGGTLISSSAVVSNWVWDTRPGDLRVQVEKMLLAMGIDKAVVDRLLRHQYYTLSMQAAVASSLDKLSGADGRVDVMPLALDVGAYGQSRFVVGTLAMLANYHKSVGKVKRLQAAGTIVAHTGGGGLVVAAPVDCLSWTEGMDRFSKRKEFQGQKPHLIVAGMLTDRAKAELKKRGWRITEKSVLFPASGTEGK